MITEVDPPVILRTNLCTNPNFETNATGWSAQSSTIATSTGEAHSGLYSLLCTLTAAVGAGAYASFTQTVGAVYTLSAWVYAPSSLTIRAAYTGGSVSAGGTATTIPAGVWTRVSVTGTATATTGYLSVITTVAPSSGSLMYVDDALIEASAVLGTYFDGSTPETGSYLYQWSGVANGSTSYQMSAPTYMPVQDLTTLEVLYGSRTTSYRYELLTHNADGTDSLSGYLDGVQPGGSANWQWNQAVKGTISSLNVLDLDAPQAGLNRVRDVSLTSIRIRPVLVIDGLPEIPLGVFLVTAAPEVWSDQGRTFQLELHDRTTTLDQDQIDQTFTADATTPVMTQIANLIATAGEKFTPDNSETRTLTAPAVWQVGTTKLQIVNDLLGALNYNALTINGNGDFQATPSVLPAYRTITYQLLNGVPRELVDGPTSIYQPDWNRDRDVYGVPTEVVAVGVGTGTAAPPQGSYANTDPSSPFSSAARGRNIVSTITGVQTPSGTDPVAFLNNVARASLIAQSSPQATVTVKHLPLPLNVGDVIRFASAPAGIDTRHVVVGLQLDLTPTGLMQSSLQEVIDL